MGHLFSTLVDTTWKLQDIKDSPLLVLPDEAIIRILILLAPTERKNLRLTCKKLAHDVRHFVGAVDSCIINNTTSSNAITFYGNSAFRNITVSRNCTGWNFQELFHHPQFLKEFRLTRGGAVSPQVAIDLLLKCKGLQNLTWSGHIYSVPTIAYGAEYIESILPLTRLPKLTTLHLNSTRPPRYNPFAIRKWYELKDCSFLLTRLICSKLEDVTLVLATVGDGRDKEKGETQLELSRDVYNFLHRNKPDRKGKKLSLSIYHKETFVTQPNDSTIDRMMGICGFDDDFEFYEDEDQNDSINHSIPLPPENLKIKDFLFSSEMENYDYRNTSDKDYFETHMLKLVMRMKTLETLKLKTRGQRPVKWGWLIQAVTHNFNTLVHLELTSFLHGSFDFEIFSKCTSLKCLKIDRKDWNGKTVFDLEEGNTPLLLNFGPHRNMMRKLEILILTNLGLNQQDLYRLKYLKNLKHLVIDYWRNECGCEGVTFDILKTLLHIRSLDSLHLLQNQFRHENFNEMKSLEYGMHKLGFNYVHDQTEQHSIFAISSNGTSFWSDPFKTPEE